MCSSPSLRLSVAPTCQPGQRGSVGFGFERRPLLHAALLRVASVPPGAGSPQQSVPARLGQLVDELLLHVLGADPRLLVPSEGTTHSLSLDTSWKWVCWFIAHIKFHKVQQILS